MTSLSTLIQQAARKLGLRAAPPPRSVPSAQPGWSGNGMVATLNGTGFMFERRDRFADAFIAYAGEVRRPVLEVGCAYGVSTLPALEAGGIVTASDMEQGHLDILEKKVPPHLRDRLALVCGKLPDMDFPAGHFAGILCSRVLHFLTGEDVEASIHKMASWLEPGGKLFLVADTPYGIWRKAIPQFEEGKKNGVRWPGMMVGLHNYLATDRPVKPIEKPPFMNVMDHELLARTCREAGLDVVEAAYIPRPDFGGMGSMDGRENAGVVAIKPR